MCRQLAISTLAVAAVALSASASTAAAAARPVVPAALGIAVSPQPGTASANPDTQISFLGVPASSIRNLSVQGSVSGRHSGRLASYASRAGASFLPAHTGFQPGERVSVRADVLSSGTTRPIAFSFVTATPVAIPRNPVGTPRAPKPGEVQSFQSRPDLNPPTLKVTAASPSAAAGDIFLAPISGPGGHGPMIVDGAGNLVYFHPVANDAVMDFKVQTYQGHPVLTWWQGFISNLGIGFGERQIVDSSYRRIATLQAGNGYLVDLHDFQLEPDGSALLTAYAPVRRNLSFAGGASQGTVLDAVVQQIDVKTGLVMFEWHAMGHVGLTESYNPVPRTSVPYDYFHLNSVEVDHGGSLLISARNTWAAYEISPLTGGVIWRLGGKRSTFAMGPGAQFSWQHDARRLADGTISVFDDGAAPKVESQSRAEVLNVDVQHHTATVAHQLTHPTPLLAGSQGNAQFLANGDAFVGWGQVSYVSEFSPTGQLLFDASFPPPGESYRAFRIPWTGTPGSVPNLKVVASAAGRTTVYASWNGATGVAAWKVLGGSASAVAHMTAVGQAARTGFETSATVTSGGPYFAVQALDAGGRVLATSSAARAAGR
jgi:hypothetical protein